MPDLSPRYAGPGYLKYWMEVFRHLEGEIASHHIYNFAQVNAQIIGEMEDLHIDNIKDIPESFKLKPKQKWQITANKTGERHMKPDKIKEFLDTFEYPLYFLDYETAAGVIPPFEGLRSSENLPFQYSLHILYKPNGKLIHKEYLHTKNTDPTLPFIKKLKKVIGKEGTILVWYQNFEKGCNDLLSSRQREYSEFLKDVNKRIKDLMIPFSKGWFVDKEFKGSASIKNVLPVLVDELSYHHLDINEGLTAQRIWLETFVLDKNQDKKAKITKDLLEYCKLDTFAMVKILEVLQKLK